MTQILHFCWLLPLRIIDALDIKENNNYHHLLAAVSCEPICNFPVLFVLLF